jgi:hypothetical protein
MPFVSSTLRSFEKWLSPLSSATGNFNHQILPYGKLGSYISAREQQIIIKNAISGQGNLKAGAPQGFILGPLLFLIFIKGKECIHVTIGLNVS